MPRGYLAYCPVTAAPMVAHEGIDDLHHLCVRCELCQETCKNVAIAMNSDGKLLLRHAIHRVCQALRAKHRGESCASHCLRLTSKLQKPQDFGKRQLHLR